MKFLKYVLGAAIISLTLLVLFWFWLTRTEPGASWVWHRAVGATDGALQGEVVSGNLVGGIELQDFLYTSAKTDVSSPSVRAALEVDVMPLRINVRSIAAAKALVAVKVSDTDEDSRTDVAAVLTAMQLPFRLDVARASVSQLELRQHDRETLYFNGILASFSWFDVIRIRQFEAGVLDDSLSAQGSINLKKPQTFSLRTVVNYDELEATASIDGDPQQAKTNNLVLNSPDLAATGEAEVRWHDELTGNAKLQLARFNLATLTDEWPESHDVQGALNLQVTPEELRFSESTLAVAGTDTTVSFDAVFARLAETVTADLDWQNLKWPINADNPAVRSAEGSVQVSGTLDNWTLDGSMAVDTAAMPDGRFVVRGEGNRDEARASITEGRVFGGRVAGQAAYRWRDENPWSAQLAVTAIQTAGLVPDWPGSVSGTINASGTRQPFAIDASLQDVAGSLREVKLRANGGFAYKDGIASARKLSLEYGAAQALLNGSADTPAGLVFRGSVEQLQTFVEGASGALEASGRVSRSPDGQYLSLDLNSDELVIGNVVLSGLSVSDDRPDDAIAGFVAQIESVKVAGREIDDVELHTVIRKDQQMLSIRGSRDELDVSLAIDGSFDNWQTPLDSDWRGRVSAFNANLHDEHSMRLNDPAPLEFAAGRFSLQDFCLSDAAVARSCANFRFVDGGVLEVDATLQDIPVGILEHAFEYELSFDQLVSGSVNWRTQAATGAHGSGELSFTAGSIRSIEEPDLVLPTGGIEVSFDVTDGELLAGRLIAPLPGVGAIAGNFNILDVTNVATSGVQGHLSCVITDIELLAHFSPLIDLAYGRILAELDLSGSVAEPLLTGNVQIADGGIHYQPIGLNIDDVNMVGTLTRNKAIELSGQFRAGDGRGEIVSSAEYRENDESGLRFKVRGTDLLLVDVPDVKIYANPDFELAYSKDLLSIDGSITLPTVQISPANLAEGRIDESDDVVIVAGTLPEEELAAPKDSKLRYEGSLEIELGEDVAVDLDIAKAHLAGSAVFNWRGPAMPVVDGRYNISGTIQAFGQVLDITEGAIRYANAPANVPYLRIRAEREIYGNSQVKTAGVLVEGVANRPNISAYTQPLTTEERALTLLVTGSDFDYEQGVGAIDFGTYIAPRLFVSYGVGVFDRENVISARYDLTKGFGIKASSGSNESGVDLNYRIEN